MRLCSLKMYNNLVERCFRECTEDMRSKTLSSKEEQVRARLHGYVSLQHIKGERE